MNTRYLATPERKVRQLMYRRGLEFFHTVAQFDLAIRVARQRRLNQEKEST